LTRARPYIGYDFNLSVFDLDNEDSIYWRVFLDYQESPSQALELDIEEGEVLPSSAVQGRRQIRFVVDAFDERFFTSASPLTAAHEVEVVVADRPFSDASPLESREPDAAFPEGQFDIVTCLEMLEHVPDPQSVIAAAAGLLQPGGRLFLSTINRNPRAFALAILGAEYLLRLLPRGTHEYRKFIKPSELASGLRAQGLRIDDLSGMTYHPLSRSYSLGRDLDVNYLLAASFDG